MQRRGARPGRRPEPAGRARPVQPRAERAAPHDRRGRVRPVRAAGGGQPGGRRRPGPRARRGPGPGRDPAHRDGPAHRSGQHLGQPALPPPQRTDHRRPPRRGGDRHPWRRAPAGHHRVDPAGGGQHQCPAAPAGHTGDVRQLLERVPGHRRRPGRGRRELAVSVRPAALGRDPGTPVRAGHRHPAGRAEEPGRTPARLVRRAVDHVDLRPLRGERPLLPGPAADLRSGGPGPGRGRPAGCRAWRELRLHNGTVYRWNRPVYDIGPDFGRPHLRVENRVLPAGPTVVDMLANAAFYFGLIRTFAEADRPVWSQLPVHRGRAELLPRPAAPGSRRPCPGRATGRSG